jgi:GNAT superfamily N-acetyltransferase
LRGDQARQGQGVAREPLPGYPPGLERSARLADGREVFIRPIVPDDAGELAEAIKTADPDTLRRRFLGSAPPVTSKVLEHLTVVDYRTRFALVAWDATTGRGVGVARYEGLGDGTAEVAVAVDPAWRRVGLAAILVDMLAEAAIERGIHRFTASYRADNRPVAALLAGVGGASLIRHGIAESEIALDRDQPDPPARRS